MKASRADCEGESVNSDGSDSKYCHKNKHSSQAFDVKLHGFGRTFVNEFCYIETALSEFPWQKVWSYEWIIRNCFAKKKALAKVSNNPRFVDYQHEFPSALTFHLPHYAACRSYIEAIKSWRIFNEFDLCKKTSEKSQFHFVASWTLILELVSWRILRRLMM